MKHALQVAVTVKPMDGKQHKKKKTFKIIPKDDKMEERGGVSTSKVETNDMVLEKGRLWFNGEDYAPVERGPFTGKTFDV